MGWLSSSNTDYIITAEKSWVHTLYLWIGAGTVMQQTITVTNKWAGSMDYSTASAAMAAYKLAHPTADVQIERQNDAGAYRIVINETTATDWEAPA